MENGEAMERRGDREERRDKGSGEVWRGEEEEEDSDVRGEGEREKRADVGEG